MIQVCPLPPGVGVKGQTCIMPIQWCAATGDDICVVYASFHPSGSQSGSCRGWQFSGLRHLGLWRACISAGEEHFSCNDPLSTLGWRHEYLLDTCPLAGKCSSPAEIQSSTMVFGGFGRCAPADRSMRGTIIVSSATAPHLRARTCARTFEQRSVNGIPQLLLAV